MHVYVAIEVWRKIQKGTHEEVHIGYWRSVGEHEGGGWSLKGEAKKKKEKGKNSSKKARLIFI